MQLPPEAPVFLSYPWAHWFVPAKIPLRYSPLVKQYLVSFVVDSSTSVIKKSVGQAVFQAPLKSYTRTFRGLGSVTYDSVSTRAALPCTTSSQDYTAHLPGLTPGTSDWLGWSKGSIHNQWMSEWWVNLLNDSLNLLSHVGIQKHSVPQSINACKYS